MQTLLDFYKEKKVKFSHFRVHLRGRNKSLFLVVASIKFAYFLIESKVHMAVGITKYKSLLELL